MKKAFPGLLLLILTILALAACAPVPAPPAPTLTAVPTAPLPPPTSEPTVPPPAADPGLIAPPPLSFEAETYVDQANGFELDYPSGWTLIPNTQTGSRGSSAVLLSPGATLENLPAGGTRVGINIYQWDPKQDLAAYAAHRQVAWEASGSTVTSMPGGILADGRERMSFIVQGADNLMSLFQFTTLGDAYLEISGQGELALIQEIANTVRPLNFRP